MLVLQHHLLTSFIILILIIIVFKEIIISMNNCKNNLIKSIAVIQSPDKKINGIVYLEEIEYNKVSIKGNISGLADGEYGFHVHTYGDTSEGIQNIGDHFNPYNNNHGSRISRDLYGREITNKKRHMGDLGNISSKNNIAEFSFTDDVILLNGYNSVIGRTLAIHEHKDDLGSGNKNSLKHGNSGNIIAYGIIGHAKKK